MLTPYKLNELVHYVHQNPDSINAQDANGATPLHKAVEFANNFKAIRFLHESGANVGAKDFAGNRPLHYALKINNNENNIRILLDNGANPLSKNNNGETSLHFAAGLGKKTEMEEFLKLGSTREHIDIADNIGSTALVRALYAKNNLIIAKLLENGANPLITNTKRETLLHIASRLGNGTALYIFFENDDLKKFVDVKDSRGRTPLMSAFLIPNNNHVISVLIKNGADKFKVDNDGCCLLNYAMSIDGNEFYVKKLLQYTPLSMVKALQGITKNDHYRELCDDWIQAYEPDWIEQQHQKEIDAWSAQIDKLPGNFNKNKSNLTNNSFIPIENSKGLIEVDSRSLR
jgi:ankyrin repeat protein